MSDQPTVESFLKDVSGHRLEIIRDDGLYRHLRFSKDGSNVMRFDLVTWPGYLCFCGDMQEFVFQRLADMFEFFRGEPGDFERQRWRIDRRYWAEKVQASPHEGVRQYSPDAFRAAIASYLQYREPSPDLLEAIDAEVLNHADDYFEAVTAVRDFEHEDFRFTDFFEHSIEDYTYHFTWCCFALRWGIQQYDLATAQVRA